MINILTSIGNPILNNELRKIKNFNIIKNDIKYENIGGLNDYKNMELVKKIIMG